MIYYPGGCLVWREKGFLIWPFGEGHKRSWRRVRWSVWYFGISMGLWVKSRDRRGAAAPVRRAPRELWDIGHGDRRAVRRS